MRGIVTDQAGFRAVFWVYFAIALVTLLVSLSITETGTPARAQGRSMFNLGGLSEVEPRYRVTFLIVILNTFAAMMRGSLLHSMLPLLAAFQLGMSSTEVGALFAVHGFANLVMILPTGFLTDSLGRKAAAVPSALLATLAFLGFPFATNFLQLAFFSALSGVATGLALSTMSTYTYDLIPANARGRLQTLRRLIGEMGGAAGPSLGGIVANFHAPSSAFLLYVPFQLVSGLLLVFVAKETLPRKRTIGKVLADGP